MTQSRPTLRTIAVLALGLAVLGCGDEDGNPSGNGNQGGDGQGGQGGDGQGEGGGGQSGGGCKCEADELCITCNTAGPPSMTCVATKSPSANEFACKWTACAVGEICLDIEPAGDGCPDAQCAPVPAECAADPTCTCVEPAFNSAFSCKEDDAGNVTVKKFPF